MKHEYSILFMPSWYPTKENPLSGSFFKEQCMVLAENFNFAVLHYSIRNIGILQLLKRCIFNSFETINFDQTEQNLPEMFFEGVRFSPRGVLGLLMSKLKVLRIINKYISSRNCTNLKTTLRNELGFKPDLLYSVTAQVNAIETEMLASYFNIPYVVGEHCPFPLPGKMITEEMRKAIENADCIFCPSLDVQKHLLMQNIFGRFEIVGNLIDEELFNIDLSVHKTIFTIIFVGSYNYFKDFQTFFKTVSLLRKSTNKPFKINIVGVHPVSINSIFNSPLDELYDLLDKYGIKDICTIVSSVPRQKMPSYYNKSDVCVITSIAETFSVTCREATSCGLPVYATRCGGVDDFIDDSNGCLVNILDFQTLASELKKLIEGEVSYDSDLIRKKTIKRYGKDVFKNRISSIFNRIIRNYKK